MAFTLRIQLFVAVLFFSLLSQVIGHSYLTSPISRSNQAQTQAGCRGPACLGPCDVPLAQATRAPIVAARGDSITVEWPRNNHAGGFIRFAWAPTSMSDTHAAFDTHVQQINCHEIGNPTPGQCAPLDPINDPNGSGSGPADGSSGACNIVITVPRDLTDGKWTLQWAWFGGAFTLGDYYSCVDYTIAGGPSGLLTPVFIGGDFTYPNQQKCKFFNTDKLHVCINEPCQNPIYPSSQQESGPPAAGQLGASVSVPVSVPISVPVSVPSTTGVKSPATTGAAKPITTGVKSPATTGVPKPITTGAKSSSTTGAKSSTTPVPTASNCAGVTTLSASTASFASVDSWGTQFHALININVQETILTDWVLEVTWPSYDSTVAVVSFFNGGALQCTGTNTAYFKPSAFWSNNLPAGSSAQVEFIATNNNMAASYIMANTQLRVLKH